LHITTTEWFEIVIVYYLYDILVSVQGLQHEGLRDEIFCQLANQTWGNQKLGPAERVWQLMAHCLSAFQPSPSLYKYLLK